MAKKFRLLYQEGKVAFERCDMDRNNPAEIAAAKDIKNPFENATLSEKPCCFQENFVYDSLFVKSNIDIESNRSEEHFCQIKLSNVDLQKSHLNCKD